MTSEDARKLFVAGLSESIDENVLRDLFEGTGTTIVSISLPRDRATGRPRGFGFVTLATEDEADRARGVLDGTIQGGRAISTTTRQSVPKLVPSRLLPCRLQKARRCMWAICRTT